MAGRHSYQLKTMNTQLKVLVVDDEPDILEILSYNLTKENYEVLTATNGPDCIRKVREHRPDLIILDIRMQGASGIEVCRELKQDMALKDIPVLFLTADSDEYTTLQAAEAGGEHYVTKPIRPGIIMSLVNEILHPTKTS